jgi:signal transduction histidine kinase
VGDSAGAPTVAGAGAAEAARSWQPTRRSDLADLALAVALGAGAALSLYIGGDENLVGPELADYDRPAGIALVALIIAPLVVRRRFPLTVLAATSVAYIPFTLLEIPELTAAPIGYFIALYTAGAYGGPRRDWFRALAVLTVCVLVAEALRTNDSYDGRVSLWMVNVFAVAQNVFYLAAAWFLGDLVRNRREREATLVAQAEALQGAQADRARRAVLDERVRIARELHDVVAHHVSVMGVQAGAARRVLDTRPVAVPELLTSIEGSSREAVAELQRMLGLLRGDGERDRAPEAGDRADPQPTIAQLDTLVGHMAEAGLDVSATVEGGTGGLPPGIDLSAYRIVQEALTNTLKHAGPGTAATVSVVRRPRSLEIAVRDDGRSPAASRGASGGGEATGAAGNGVATGVAATSGAGTVDGQRLGLVGMRERVALLGGELKTGRAEGGGFEVRAWLPLPDRGPRA